MESGCRTNGGWIPAPGDARMTGAKPGIREGSPRSFRSAGCSFRRLAARKVYALPTSYCPVGKKVTRMAAVRIAFCITDLELGGAERCLTELATRLDRKRFEPIVYCLAPLPDDESNSCVPRLAAAGVPHVSLGARGLLHGPGATLRLIADWRRRRPDVVQSFLFHANLVARVAARMTGVTGVVAGIRVAEQRHRWHLRLDRATQRMVDAYVCVSRSVADFSHDVGRLPAEKMHVIPNGIDPQLYPSPKAIDPGRLGIPVQGRIVACVGRLDPQKDQAELIRSATDWMTERPDVHLLLVGQGPDRQRLECMARATPVAERIHFTGWREDVPEILAASTLLTLPSRWEGMPNVVLEAMASRLPVVAADVEGVRELLGPAAGEQVLPIERRRLREAGDGNGPMADGVSDGGQAASPTSFAERIGKILDDPALANRLAMANRARAESEFGIDRVVEQYEKLWWGLANR